MTPEIRIPDFCLVALIGVSGSGKSTFARAHFKPTEVLSSDVCRGLVSDDENDQSATNDAFEVLHTIASRRLARMRLTVIDATNVQADARRKLLELARAHHALPVAIVLDLPERVCVERNAQRPERSFGRHVIARQRAELRAGLRNLQREGFRNVTVLRDPEQIAAATIVREPLWTDRRGELGPFDIIGDIHGCYDELVELLGQLGYSVEADHHRATPPAGRRAIFLGDLVDRGPKSPDVLKLVMGMVAAGQALCVPGNHDVKLLRKLNGRDVRITHGLAETLAQLAPEPADWVEQVRLFLEGLISHFVLDEGRLVVAHAGMKAEMAGRASGAVREFALYGETTGETDEFGLPVRHNWAAGYRAAATVVYGHTPVPEPEWLNRTINIDTGCVFGGALTALRYPERELVSVPAQYTYAEPARPFLEPGEPAPALSAQQQLDDLLDISDVLALDDNLGQRYVTTRLGRSVGIAAARAAAALEVISRFAVNPKWLIYLPPTMSPVETSPRPDLLEHPDQAFSYYRDQGVPRVICQEKHMGSRAVVVLGRDEAAIRARFGIEGEGSGVIYTRTGRRFFDDLVLEQAVLEQVRQAASGAGLWEALQTEWLALDCELMPWSAKAQELLRFQYAAVGAAGRASLDQTLAALALAAHSQEGAAALVDHYQQRAADLQAYTAAYGRYCWPVHSLSDLRLAPFHVLASEGRVHIDKPHPWHLEWIGRLQREGDTVVYPTAHQIVDVTDLDSQRAGAEWWDALTASGGEGMVVKPLDFVAQGPRGLAQPAVKVRGREYLRIIYGPEYTAPDQLARLRRRGLGAKRALAAREFALGIEGLERFVRREPLRRVHECVFAVLALESEPVDPRL